MDLKIPQNQEERLKKLEKTERERIRKKLREIDKKISELSLSPEQVIEKRLKGKLHPLLQ